MQVESILDEFDCLELVKGNEVAPNPTTQEGLVAGWLKKRKKACSVILASCTPSALIYLERIKDPVEMWKTLENKYVPKSSTTCEVVPGRTTEFLKKLSALFIDNAQGGKKPPLPIPCLDYV